MEIDEFLNKELGAAKEKSSEIEDLPEEIKAALRGRKPEAALMPISAPEAQPEKKFEARKEAMPDVTGAESGIDALIAEANSLISKGDFEGARRIYLKIKDIKKELPHRFMKAEEKVSNDLLSLNEKILSGMDRSLNTEFNDKFSRINRLIDEAYSLTSNNVISSVENLSKVESTYNQVKDIYLALPEGFMEKKVMVQDQMLKLYRIIITNKKNLLASDFSGKSREIIKFMKIVADEMGKGNIDNASKLFAEVTRLYKELPQGFLRDKTELQSQILDIYHQLVVGRQNRSLNEFEGKAKQIRSLFSDAYALVKKNDIKDAQNSYNNIADIYAKLPSGYYSQKADIEIEMMELHHLLSLKKDKELLEETKAKVNEMETLFNSARNYIANREYDMAREVYGEVIEDYNSLPEGFFEENVKMQNRIIQLYKDLLSHAHEAITAETTREEKSKYDQLIKILVEIHSHIKKKEFSEIKGKYLSAYKLYHELPLGLIEEKKDLYKEIYKIYEELMLYASLEKLPEHADRQDYKSMADLLGAIAEQYNLLSKKYPEDMEIFSHIQAKSLLYLNMIKEKQGRKDAVSGADIKKKIEDVISQQKKMGQAITFKRPEEKDAEGKADAQGRDAEDYIKGKYGQ